MRGTPLHSAVRTGSRLTHSARLPGRWWAARGRLDWLACSPSDFVIPEVVYSNFLRFGPISVKSFNFKNDSSIVSIKSDNFYKIAGVNHNFQL